MPAATKSELAENVCRVLLVEDNPDDALLISRALQRSAKRYAITVAGTVQAGLEQLEANGFDVLLLDLWLPDGSGLQLLTDIRAACDLPVLVLTGHDDEALVQEALQAGAQDCLFKQRLDSYWLPRAVFQAIERYKNDRQLRFRANLLNAAGEAIIATDMAGRVTYWNQAAEALYGWSKREVLEQSALDFTASSVDRAVVEAIGAELGTR